MIVSILQVFGWGSHSRIEDEDWLALELLLQGGDFLYRLTRMRQMDIRGITVLIRRMHLLQTQALKLLSSCTSLVFHA